MGNRRAVRIVAAVGVIVEIDGKGLPCLTGTVSAGGMYVQLRHAVAAGATIKVTIPEAGRLELAARVASNDGNGLGLALTLEPPEKAQAWQRFLKRLLRRSTEEVDTTAPEHDGHVAWAHFPDGKLLSVFKKRVHKDELLDLTVDGAAFATSSPPELETPLLIFVIETSDGERKEYHCQAKVVRHLDQGFAVRFDKPNVEFRRVVSRLRQGLFTG